LSEINTVAVLGAGALGAAYAAKFSHTSPTVLIARGERYRRLKAHGLVVNGQQYQLPVKHPDEAPSPVDFILVALKHHHLEAALPDLGPFIGQGTTILSVMNGLDSESIIGERYGMDKLVYAISVGIDALRDGNAVTYTTMGRIIFGEAENTTISSRVERVQRLFERAGMAYETPPDMMRMLWWKFMVNVGVNQASAVTRAPYGVFLTDPEAQALMESLMREAIALAQAGGVDLREADIAEWYRTMGSLSPQGKTSMLQDIEAGRQTEVEIFAGKVVALGKEHNIPTPVNQTLLRIIRVLEQK